MTDDTSTPPRVRWARLRFAIIGPLLSAPPERGELVTRLAELAERRWRHPTTGESLRFSAKTIEHWYYQAREAADPIAVLERKVPSHAGTYPSMPDKVGAALEGQYRQHPRWSYQLHHDNLVAQGKIDPTLGPVPGYATLCRYMKDKGWLRRKRRRREEEPGFVPRERRSFEVAHVHGLWHADFHESSRKVITASGEWKVPVLVGFLDDCSRLCCHLQWYLAETAEFFIHGLSQAIAKRGLPRALLTDNGAAMLAAETTQGLERLSIVHHTTLPETPEQNGKQERFWGQVEGRLMAMLEGEPQLTLELLNLATQAWVEQEYHRRVHDELGQTPLDRYLAGPDVGRQSPSSEALRHAFRLEVTRRQRRSDGTITVDGVRFEVPSAYRALSRVSVRVARWDLASVDLVDPRTGALLAVLAPLDKLANADRRRRALVSDPASPLPPAGLAPHLRALMAEYAATGLPPAYLPTDNPAPQEDQEP